MFQEREWSLSSRKTRELFKKYFNSNPNRLKIFWDFFFPPNYKFEIVSKIKVRLKKDFWQLNMIAHVCILEFILLRWFSVQGVEHRKNWCRIFYLGNTISESPKMEIAWGRSFQFLYHKHLNAFVEIHPKQLRDINLINRRCVQSCCFIAVKSSLNMAKSLNKLRMLSFIVLSLLWQGCYQACELEFDTNNNKF